MDAKLSELHALYKKHAKVIIGTADCFSIAICPCGRIYIAYTKDIPSWYYLTDKDLEGTGEGYTILQIINSNPIAKATYEALAHSGRALAHSGREWPRVGIDG